MRRRVEAGVCTQRVVKRQRRKGVRTTRGRILSIGGVMRHIDRRAALCAAFAAGALAVGYAAPSAAWEPPKPIEFVVPPGTGGAADQRAPSRRGVIAKPTRPKQPS